MFIFDEYERVNKKCAKESVLSERLAGHVCVCESVSFGGDMGGRKEKDLLCVCRAKFTQQEKVCLPEETGTETSPHILTEFSQQ